MVRDLPTSSENNIEKYGDFRDLDDAVDKITDVVNNGEVREDNDNTFKIEYGDYRVVVVPDQEGNWILSAFDYKISKREKLRRKDAAAHGTPGQPDVEAGAVTPNLSADKITAKESDLQENSGKKSHIASDETVRFRTSAAEHNQTKIRQHVDKIVKSQGRYRDNMNVLSRLYRRSISLKWSVYKNRKVIVYTDGGEKIYEK